MKLYYMTGACPLVTRIALEWIGKPFESQRVSRDELQQEEFLKLNPNGAVPVLLDGDLVLTQSIAILEYLNEKNPQANLLGSTIEQRFEARRWLAFLNAEIHRNVGVVFGVHRYADQEATQAEVKAKTAALLTKQLGVIDKHLEGKETLSGSLSVADAYLYVVLRWAGLMKLDLSGMKNLNAFFARMEQNEGVKAALRGEGLLKD